MKKLILAVAAATLLVGCAHQTNTGNAYNTAQSRQAQIVQRGRVIAIKDVKIDARQSGAGALGGAALGGIAGSRNGSSGSNKSAASGIAGILIGGAIGAVAERNLSSLEGQEISIIMDNGTEIAIAQEIDEKEGKFQVGERVRILSGTGVTRVVR
jgi:outer membrane lipoprotein SlyB